MRTPTRRWFTFVVAAVVLTVMVVTTTMAQPAPLSRSVPPTPPIFEAAELSATYIVVLRDAPLAAYRGQLPGLEATSPAVVGTDKLDPDSRASQDYLAYLAHQRQAAIASANRLLGRPLDVQYEYMATLNGFASSMTESEAAAVETLDNVWFVEREKRSMPQTDAGPQWIHADDIWNGLGSLSGTKGEGIIVGVIDSGIDPWNPSFADVGGDGYDHTNPNGAGVYLGVCDPGNTSPPAGTVAYDSSFPCNDKLIGVWGYTAADSNPRDNDGHGSHTASTAAGNVVQNASIDAPTTAVTANISGVAPHANIIAYDACTDNAGCPGAALNAARDQALLDGVDIINYSIGASAPTADPWTDSEAIQWLTLRDAGVFVATSAGNNGPDDTTIGSPADVPWLTAVGANSHDRYFMNAIELDNGSDTPITIYGASLTDGYGPAPVVLAADFAPGGDDARLCAPGTFAPGTFSGQIVVCERGIYGRIDKGQEVLDAGAGGYILAQPEAEGGGAAALVSDPHVLPAVHIDYASYQALLAYKALTGSTDGTIAGTTVSTDAAYGDIMASFSSRGPNQSLPDIIVPSVTAPGRSIWAAYKQGSGGDTNFTFSLLDGTSMSSPHVAGAAALIKALHPSWTPAEIQSALMTTARTTVLNDDGISPTTATAFDIGSGHIDLARAALAELLFDETTADYQAANPTLGGDPRAINLASLADANCIGSCNWTRTVSRPSDSTVAGSLTWNASYTGAGSATITPNQLTMAPGADATFSVTLDVSALAGGQWHFGQVTWTEDTDDAPAVHLPVAVFVPAQNIEVNPTQIQRAIPLDTAVDETITITNTGATDLTWTIAEASPTLSSLTAAPQIFWNQPSLGGSGFFSDYFNENSSGTYSAVDFSTTFETDVTEIFVEGFMNTAGLSDATALTWTIYTDSAGVPAGQPENGGGTELWTFTAVPTAPGIDITDNNILLDLASSTAPALTLPPGTYWLVVYPSIDTSTYGPWIWYQAAQQDAEAHVIDPGANTFTQPVTSWIPYSSVSGLDIRDLAFRMTGIVKNGCDTPADVGWLTAVAPTSGTTSPLTSSQVDLTLDATGLSAGDYAATLCINSNDPDTPQVAVRIDLTVLAAAPRISVDPPTVDTTLPPNTTDQQALTIHNAGSQALNWSADEAASVSNQPEAASPAVDWFGTAAPAPSPESHAPTAPLTAAFAEATVDTAVNSADPFALAAPAASQVLYAQIDEIVPTGVTSQQFEAAFSAYTSAAADDFVVPAGDGGWVIERVEAFGFYSSGGGPASSVNIAFYADLNGQPAASSLYSETVTPVSAADGTLVLDLTTPLALQPGAYWVSVQPSMSFNALGRWYWLQRAVLANSEGVWRNPGDGFGSGCTSWSPLTDCGLSDPDLAFRLTGETQCSQASDIPWASLSSTSGTTAVGDYTDIIITVDSTGLSAGTYNAAVCINSDDPTTPLVRVPLSLTVDSGCTAVAPVAPTLTGTTSADHVQLAWTGSPDNLGGYNIHRAAAPYFTAGAANQLAPTRPVGTASYVDVGALSGSPSALFYQVSGVNCDASATAVSNELGVFTFELTPGAP